MIGLGVESTAHTFSCAILEKKGKQVKILSDVRKIYRPPEGEGIHPREASRYHVENSAIVLSECLQEAGITIKDLDIISYAAGPGLGPCLRVGAVVARSLASYYNIPIYPVNHAIGHIELGKLLTGGKNIEDLALSTSNYVLLPYSVKGNDVSFSGLLSATKSIVQKSKADACFSLQETAFAMISETVERALSFTRKKELLIVGGVAANKRLSEMLQDVCKRHRCKFFVAPQKYAGDCGSQICWTGLLESQVKKGVSLKETFVTQSWRLDSVKVDY